MHDSFSSLGGMVLLINMLLGEFVFGGLGSGLYSMVMAAAIAVFLPGLMVGHTPDYLGKKDRTGRKQMIMLYVHRSCFANNGQTFAGLSANTPSIT